MEPTFYEGERVFASALICRVKNPRQGDVVILSHPFRNIRIIKRIKEVSPDDRYLVASDNSLEGEDSRAFGAIKREQIIGKVLCKY